MRRPFTGELIHALAVMALLSSGCDNELGKVQASVSASRCPEAPPTVAADVRVQNNCIARSDENGGVWFLGAFAEVPAGSAWHVACTFNPGRCSVARLNLRGAHAGKALTLDDVFVISDKAPIDRSGNVYHVYSEHGGPHDDGSKLVKIDLDTHTFTAWTIESVTPLRVSRKEVACPEPTPTKAKP